MLTPVLVFCLAASIVNGAVRMGYLARKTKHGEMLYQVSIQKNLNHVCGGALISQFHVLTAAHCVDHLVLYPEILDYVSVTVEVGTSKLHHGVHLGVKRISFKRGFIPSEIGPFILPNDIAVITLRDSAALSSNVRILNLPSPLFKLTATTKVLVSGFGSNIYGGNVSLDMRRSELVLLAKEECSNYFYYNRGRILQEAQICAVGNHGEGPCSGDSGGPMVYGGNVVVGVVSAGEYLCGSGYPDIYTKVSYHLDYINYEMNYQYVYDAGTRSPAKAVNLADPVQNYPEPEYATGWPNQFSLVPFSKPPNRAQSRIDLDPQADTSSEPGSSLGPVIPTVPSIPSTPLILGDLFIIRPLSRRRVQSN